MTNNIPSTVSSLIGKKVNNIKVLRYMPKSSEPGKPIVECRCLACKKLFKVNVYHIKYGTKTSCGCVKLDSDTKKVWAVTHRQAKKSSKK